MKKILFIIAALPLSGCAGQNIDVCKYSELRRITYQSTIMAADAYAFAHDGYMPEAMRLGRETAVTALSILNVNCPAPSASGSLQGTLAPR